MATSSLTANILHGHKLSRHQPSTSTTNHTSAESEWWNVHGVRLVFHLLSSRDRLMWPRSSSVSLLYHGSSFYSCASSSRRTSTSDLCAEVANATAVLDATSMHTWEYERTRGPNTLVIEQGIETLGLIYSWDVENGSNRMSIFLENRLALFVALGNSHLSIPLSFSLTHTHFAHWIASLSSRVRTNERTNERQCPPFSQFVDGCSVNNMKCSEICVYSAIMRMLPKDCNFRSYFRWACIWTGCSVYEKKRTRHDY